MIARARRSAISTPETLALFAAPPRSVFRWLILYRQVRLEVENVAQATLQKEKGQTRAA